MAFTERPNFQIPDSLTHSAGDITVTFANGSFVVSGATGLTSNTLYFLYIRDNGSGAELFFDTDVPSVYQTTNTDAILVGAFYSNESGNYGSFVTINSKPKTLEDEGISFVPGVNSNTNVLSVEGYWKRNGSEIIVEGGNTWNAGGGANDPWTTSLPINIPNMVVDNNLVPIGAARFFDSAPSGTFNFLALRQSNTEVRFVGNGGVGAGGQFDATQAGGGDSIGYEYRVGITNWLNTPLKDL